jgi:sarcosine oxidase, subunit beta
MTRSTEVLVVGAGVMGICCAHHLNERGLSVRVIERDGVAQATTAAGAGFIAYWAGGLVPPWREQELACERYAIDFYSELHAERPTFSFRRSGSLYIAMTDRGWQERVRAIAEFRALPMRRLLDPDEAAEVGVIVRREGIVGGGVFDPDTVQVVARDATRTLAGRLAESGVLIEERRPATCLIVDRGRVTGVQTPSGPVAADAVVLATGIWSNMLLRTQGVWLPYAPLGALRITTESLGLPPTVPMLQVPEVGAWLREEGEALVWGVGYEGKQRDAFLDDDPPERMEELPMDALWETQRKGVTMTPAIPCLARYHDFTYSHGAPCHTPDLLPLVGPVAAIEGLYVLGGDNEAGVTHAPGLGRALAESIAGAEPFIDLQRYRPSRFDGTYKTTREAGLAASRSLRNISWAGLASRPGQEALR